MREGIPPLAEALDAFMSDLRIEGRSPQTLRTYRAILKPLTDWPTESLCRDLIIQRLDAGQSLKTASLMHQALKSFCSFAIRRGWLVSNPLAGVPAPKVKPSPHRYLSKPQIQAVWAVANDEMRLILRLLLLGLRSNELLHVRWQDVTEGTLQVVSGKGGRHRLLALDDETYAAIMSSERVSEYVIPYSYDKLFGMVKRLGKKAGVGWVRPHDFRRSFATHFLLVTNDAHTLQQLGGWANDRMVRKYAQAALEISAVAKSREVGLTKRLLE